MAVGCARPLLRAERILFRESFVVSLVPDRDTRRNAGSLISRRAIRLYNWVGRPGVPVGQAVPDGNGLERIETAIRQAEPDLQHYQKSLRDRIPGNPASLHMKMRAKTRSCESGCSRVGQSSLERCSVPNRRVIRRVAVPGGVAVGEGFLQLGDAFGGDFLAGQVQLAKEGELGRLRQVSPF